jgi:hypothetical protein
MNLLTGDTADRHYLVLHTDTVVVVRLDIVLQSSVSFVGGGNSQAVI